MIREIWFMAKGQIKPVISKLFGPLHKKHKLKINSQHTSQVSFIFFVKKFGFSGCG
jgi:hypothetical protein